MGQSRPIHSRWGPSIPQKFWDLLYARNNKILYCDQITREEDFYPVIHECCR